MSSIEEQVKSIVAEQLGVKEEEVTNDASFVDDLGADSLDTVELVMALEEEFETEIPDEEAEKITTVQQAIDFVTARQKQRCLICEARPSGRASFPQSHSDVGSSAILTSDDTTRKTTRCSNRHGHRVPGRQQTLMLPGTTSVNGQFRYPCH